MQGRSHSAPLSGPVEDMAEPRRVREQRDHADLDGGSDQEQAGREEPEFCNRERFVRHAIPAPTCAMTMPAIVIVVAST